MIAVSRLLQEGGSNQDDDGQHDKRAPAKDEEASSNHVPLRQLKSEGDDQETGHT